MDKLCEFYGKARSIFRVQGYDSSEGQELRHYAAEWIARLQVENERMEKRIDELELTLENSAGWLENEPPEEESEADRVERESGGVVTKYTCHSLP